MIFEDKKKFFSQIKFTPFLMQYPSTEVWQKDYNKDVFLDKVLDLDIKKLNLYFHIPFCDYLCSYCSFSKILRNDEYIDKYLNKLDKEIEFWAKIIDFSKIKIETIFIGGGTPTVLNKNQIEKFGKILSRYGIKTDGEFTIETNPDRIDENFIYWKKLGVNRISIGQQTFNKKLLTKYNRNAISYTNFRNRLDFLKKIGFKNINIDMIYKLSDEYTGEILKDDLNKILEIGPEHISFYPFILYYNHLNIEELAKFFDESEKQYQIIQDTLNNQYDFYTLEYATKKNTNFKHFYQVNYLKGENVLAFGPSGFSFLSKLWFKNYFYINDYLREKILPEYVYFLENEKIDLQRQFMLGIRLNQIPQKIVEKLSINDIYFYKFFNLENGKFILKKEFRKYQNLLLYYFNQKFNGLAYN